MVLILRPLSTDRFEAELPSLPVPTLEDTAARYLASIAPYHTAQDPTSSASPLPSFAASQEAVKDFVASPLVKHLQERLQERARTEPSWLSDWWYVPKAR